MKTVIKVCALAALVASARADILLSSRDTHNVLAYNETTGAYIGVFTSGGNLGEPESIALGPDGNLYIGDRLNNSVLRYNGKTGVFMDIFIAPSAGGLNGPRNIAFAPDGNVLVSSNGSDAVLVFNGSTGAYMKTFAQATGYLPRGITFKNGEVYIASEGLNRVLRYSASGTPLGTFAADPEIQAPREIVFGPDGNLYLSSSNNNEVLRFNGSTGAFLNVFANAGLAFPRGLAFGSDGSLYVVSANTNSILRYTSAGTPTGTFTQGGSPQFPTSLVFTTNAPTFTAAGVANAASYAVGLSPGSLAVIFGKDLSSANGVVSAPSVPWPLVLANASVKIGGKDAPIFAVAKAGGQEQINVQVPVELAGQSSATVVVTNGALSSAPVTIPLVAVQPGVFAFDGVNASALHGLTNTLISPTSPAARGETVVLYLTGMGPVTPAAATNVPASGTILTNTNAVPVVTFGTSVGTVAFTGLAPTFIGLYQINVVIPETAPTGSIDMIVTANAVASRAVKLSIN